MLGVWIPYDWRWPRALLQCCLREATTAAKSAIGIHTLVKLSLAFLCLWYAATWEALWFWSVVGGKKQTWVATKRSLVFVFGSFGLSTSLFCCFLLLVSAFLGFDCLFFGFSTWFYAFFPVGVCGLLRSNLVDLSFGFSAWGFWSLFPLVSAVGFLQFWLSVFWLLLFGFCWCTTKLPALAQLPNVQSSKWRWPYVYKQTSSQICHNCVVLSFCIML